MLQLELENLSFMYTNPEDYAKVKRKVADLYKEHEKELVEVMHSFFQQGLHSDVERLSVKVFKCYRDSQV
jgi:(p)ppGpp synthase/HD superfamily hydrolase